MSTNVDTSLEHFLSVVEGIEEPCEHSDHLLRVDVHDSGPGKWYMMSKDCPDCGRPAEHKLVCEMLAKMVMSGMVEVVCYCGHSFGIGMDGYTGITRKG